MEAAFTVLASFSEALAEGAAMLPNLMFVGLFYQHYGELSYILPFVLLYAFEKAGLFMEEVIGNWNDCIPHQELINGNGSRGNIAIG